MSSKLENVTVIDSNAIANNIMTDIVDVERMERMLGSRLNSDDLFKIDCAILSSLRNTQDFSRELLEQLESGMFEATFEMPSSFELEPVDITLPLQSMFDEMAGFITEEAFT